MELETLQKVYTSVAIASAVVGIVYMSNLLYTSIKNAKTEKKVEAL